MLMIRNAQRGMGLATRYRIMPWCRVMPRTMAMLMDRITFMIRIMVKARVRDEGS